MSQKQELHAAEERSAIAETLLSSAAQLILNKNSTDIIKSVCETLCECSQHLLLAWTWFGSADTQIISPQSFAGAASGYADALIVHRNPTTEVGPAFSVLKGTEPKTYQMAPDSPFAPWREASTKFGMRSVLVVPLTTESGKDAGIFALYADHPHYFDEVGTGLFIALGKLFASILTSTAELSKLKDTAEHDSLTGMKNRHALQNIERRVQRSSVESPSAFVLIVDIDHFKHVNDNHGHLVGDDVIKSVAHIMRTTLRSNDDVVRWGGEEFLVCLPDTDLSRALLVAEKVRNAIEIHSGPVKVSASIGVAQVIPSVPLTDAIAVADKALYQAKQNGRNCVRFADA